MGYPIRQGDECLTLQRLLTSLKFYLELGGHSSEELARSWDISFLPHSLNSNQKKLCAQFTDNGQIIFPESEYQIFSYPNPPLRGFTGWDPVALVAPFWDDADFSSSLGTIFYQVSLSNSSTQDPPGASKERQRAILRVCKYYCCQSLGSVWVGSDT